MAQVSASHSPVREEMRGQVRLPLHNSFVLKTVPRKYETGESCEIGEISWYMLSTTCVSSTGYEVEKENESYLRSQVMFGISDLHKPKI
jgi:hypothetical protein